MGVREGVSGCERVLERVSEGVIRYAEGVGG